MEKVQPSTVPDGKINQAAIMKRSCFVLTRLAMLLLPGRVVLAQVRTFDSMSGGTSTPLGDNPLTHSRKARGAL